MRARLVALVLCVVVPALLVSVLEAVRAWEAGRAATERMLTARAEALASAVRRELDLSRATLQALATAPQLTTGDLAGFHARLQQIALPEGTRVLLTDDTGQILLHSNRPFGTALPKRGDPALASRVFATGEPQVSDLFFGSESRDPLIALGVPVRLDGRVAYDLAVGIRAESLHRVLVEQRLPPGWSAALVDGRGVLLSRTINPGRAVGQPAPAASAAAIAAGETPFSSTSQDGAPIRAAHAAVPGTGWTVLVAIPVARLEAPLRGALLVALVVNGGLLLTGLLAALWHARRISGPLVALSDGATALGRGDAPPPVPRGVREASAAGRALSDAASDLARRGRERDVAERRRGLLVAELNHRVKNTLATVQSLAAQTAKRADGDIGRFTHDFGGRLQALARAHDLLTASAWEGSTLGTAARQALAPWSGQGRLRVVDAGGGPGLVGPHQALALVLGLHELATNAAKHGALSRPEGRVVVRLYADAGGGVLRLDWAESGGPTLSGAQPQQGGFGKRLLERALVHDLGEGSAVRLRFEPEGLRAEIRFLPVGQKDTAFGAPNEDRAAAVVAA
ncbi:sensor histidine kinase [Craurococcus roseus]|uniref:histidine kinase n=1 Tax=Craurococcus roseus TaxID=77585 RepID=A0ABN1G1Y0_9PROT